MEIKKDTKKRTKLLCGLFLSFAIYSFGVIVTSLDVFNVTINYAIIGIGICGIVLSVIFISKLLKGDRNTKIKN